MKYSIVPEARGYVAPALAIPYAWVNDPYRWIKATLVRST
jgi:hypothetical protein